MALTLGSLFSGSGGFELAGLMAGISSVWASEIEPFPIRVTSRKMPFVKHLGDIQKIHGGKIPPVDIITFGSPCTALSQAGRRNGINGPGSVLFFQAIRIIKEMRDATGGKYPVCAVWENVVGVLSSSGQRDFQTILTEFVRIKVPEAPKVPLPEYGWPYADVIMGDGWSVAYRTLSAEFFGVPQRRRRIFLVADFEGGRAGEILFEPKSLSGDTAPHRLTGETAAGAAGPGPENSGGPCMTLYENHGKDARYRGPLNIAPAVVRYFGTGGNNLPLVMQETPKLMKIRCGCEGGGKGPLIQDNISATLSTGNDQILFVPGQLSAKSGIHSVHEPTETGDNANISSTRPFYSVRRLTPVECGRLQGFPDDWCSDLETEEPSEEEMGFWREVFETYRAVNGLKKRRTDGQIRAWLAHPHTDSAEYRMWGNGVALPCAYFVLHRIRDEIEKLHPREEI